MNPDSNPITDHRQLTIGNRSAKKMSFSPEPKQIKACFYIVFSLSVKPFDFDNRYFENQERFCPLARTAYHNFGGYNTETGVKIGNIKGSNEILISTFCSVIPISQV
jgi:hypothetical protein